MCPKTSGIARTPANKKIPNDVLDKILTQVMPHVFRVDLVGDGEILLVPERLKKVLKNAHAHKILVNASTNAVLLTEEMSDMLVSYGLHDLNISMDAAREDTYAAIRGAELAHVLKNIQCLNDVKKRRNSIFPRIQFSMVGMEKNIEELPELINLASEYGAQSVMIQAMGEFEEVKNESIYLRNKKKGKHWLDKGQAMAERKNITLNLWPEDQFNTDTQSTLHGAESSPEMQSNGLKKQASSRMKDCSFPWEVPYFATDGSVRPCCAMPPMGSLNVNTFQEIWYGDNYARLRSQLNSLNPPLECKICPGRGWFTPTICRDELQTGIDDRQFGNGWFETESYQGENYRWAREEGVFFVSGAGPGVIEVEIHSVWDPGTTQNFGLQIDKEKKHEIAFKYGERRKILLPFSSEQNLHKVSLTGKTWRPAMTVPGELDPRALSVMFYGAKIRSQQRKISFSNGITIWGWHLESTKPQSMLFRFYLELPTNMPGTNHLFLHAYPGKSEKHNPLKMMFHETMIKIPGHIKRTQADVMLQHSDHPNELQTLDIELRFAASIDEVNYNVYLGISNHDKKRVPPMGTKLHIYRSTVHLCSSKDL